MTDALTVILERVVFLFVLAAVLAVGTACAQSVEEGDSAEITDAPLYQERHRPQFHFTPRKNWMNDPNGMVYYQGEYHLFFQHNPEGREWGNMTWGHAVSDDMVHWEQLEHAIHPDSLGTIFSGSAVVDKPRTTGFGTDEQPAMVAAYTYAGEYAKPEKPYTQAIAHSVDGRTLTKYEDNPVLGNVSGGTDRDPNVLWHEPTQKWVMVLYLDQGQRFGFFTSPDLKSWTKTDEVSGFYEVPDFFELPVDGDSTNTRWVLVDAAGDYLIGHFDGAEYTVESGRHTGDYGANFYAPQTFNNEPKGRIVQMGWMNGGEYPNMPFNQQHSFPVRLTLRETDDGIRLFRYPIEEIESLRTETDSYSETGVEPGHPLLENVSGDLMDIELTFEMEEASTLGLAIGDQHVEYWASDHTVRALGELAPLEPEDGRISLRILVDRTSIEVFGNDGRIAMSTTYLRDEEGPVELSLYSQEGRAIVHAAEVHHLESIWRDATD